MAGEGALVSRRVAGAGAEQRTERTSRRGAPQSPRAQSQRRTDALGHGEGMLSGKSVADRWRCGRRKRDRERANGLKSRPVRQSGRDRSGRDRTHEEVFERHDRGEGQRRTCPRPAMRWPGECARRGDRRRPAAGATRKLRQSIARSDWPNRPQSTCRKSMGKGRVTWGERLKDLRERRGRFFLDSHRLSGWPLATALL
jgi:hypothetical protein